MIRKLSLLAAVGLAAGAVAIAQDAPKTLTGRAVMEKSEKVNRAKDEVVTATMKIFEKKTLLKERPMTMSMKSGTEYEDLSLIRFEGGDVRGTGFLTHQHGRREDDQWIYLPKTKKVKRLAAGEKKESFVGSDFAYEDLRTENLFAHEYTLKETVPVKAIEKTCFVVEAVPTADDEKSSTGYSKRVFWISTDDFLVRRIDYYQKEGATDKPFKSQYFSDFEKPESYKGFSRPKKAVMINRKEGTKTEFLFQERKIDEGLGDDVFSERELQRE